MKIQPSSNFLLVVMRALPHEGKLFIPDAVNLHPHGEVLAVGPEVKDVCVGDLVLFLACNMVMGFDEKTPNECFLLPSSAVIGKYVPEKFEELHTTQ